MDFRPARPRRRPAEAIVPMINVVFLLLIFFLMTARIAPPAPFEITPPLASGGEPATEKVSLFLSADASPSYGGASGAAAWQALAERPDDAAPLLIRADAELPAATLAQVLKRLAGLGIASVMLTTRPR
ncbi:biopolymer transporter ExbD [Actibacterium sp. MT2.3-13A]|uniref:ExbD/TolR family protein n=1 Tax=Actibacterium sp. MT2.3-13A TaxID=2828332 RepID=UPI001BA9DDE3|nr:biopolymer transporter ExbD [Actibacterium sp. MT2.3-13A]